MALCNLFILHRVPGSTANTSNWEEVEDQPSLFDSHREKRSALDIIREVKEDVKEIPHKLVIFPGTKWCGPGDVARRYSDLGFHIKEDMCCREHDHCPRSFRKGECKQGLCNTSLFTRSHCHCDIQFRNCLKDSNSKTADAIGILFFDVNRMQCYVEEPPCKPWEGTNETMSTPPSDENSQKCKLMFVDAGRYNLEKVTLRNLIDAKKCLIRKLLPGVLRCQ